MGSADRAYKGSGPANTSRIITMKTETKLKKLSGSFRKSRFHKMFT